MTDPIADIYVRAERRKALDEQEELCRQYCAEHGLTVGQVYYDTLPKPYYWQRLGLSSLRTHLAEKHIQGIVTLSLERLSQDYVQLAILLSEIEQYDATLYLVRDSDTTLYKFLRCLASFLVVVDQERNFELNIFTSEDAPEGGI